MAPVPARITWGLELLGPEPGDRVLEIGCGPGVAVALLATRAALVTALDRSATAIARARARNEAAVLHGRVVLQQGALAALNAEEAFDKALAIDVNVFWTGPAEAEASALARALVPGGRVCLVFEARRDVAPAVVRALEPFFTTEVVRGPGPLVAVRGARR